MSEASYCQAFKNIKRRLYSTRLGLALQPGYMPAINDGSGKWPSPFCAVSENGYVCIFDGGNRSQLIY